MRSHRIAGATLLWLALCAGGCGVITKFLGMENGYLLTTYDTVALPGETVKVRARLESGSFLVDQKKITIRFLRDGEVAGEAKTDDEGNACIAFTAPSPGDYAFVAEVSPAGLKREPPDPREVLVVCRRADAPLAVVDIDRTLASAGMRKVLTGDPPSAPDSVEVMNRLARDFTVIYLTYRIEYLAPKTQGWLARHGFPRGALLFSDTRGFMKGSHEFKSEALGRLRLRFAGRIIGIGDKTSDVQAYLENGAEPYLIVQPGDRDAEALRDFAKSLDGLPASVQAVSGWDEIERGLFKGEKFPVGRMQKRLRDRADALGRGVRE